MIGSVGPGIVSGGGANAFARSRRSLAEPSSAAPSNHLMTSSYYGQTANVRPASSSNSATPGTKLTFIQIHVTRFFFSILDEVVLLIIVANFCYYDDGY